MIFYRKNRYGFDDIKALYNRKICYSEFPNKSGSRISRTGNYTEFGDISNGFNIRCGEHNITILCFVKDFNGDCIALLIISAVIY